MPKRACGRYAAYTLAEKRFLVSNAGIVKPILEGGWDKMHTMHLSVYAKKNWTVESLCCCFTNFRSCKAPSGDPTIPVEVWEVKLACVQIHAKTECSTRSSDEEEDGNMFGEDVDEKEEDKNGSQELLDPNM
eukprot:11485135-Ditylum_brightwellii.AAC.1